jgi:hypothetical protein
MDNSSTKKLPSGTKTITTMLPELDSFSRASGAFLTGGLPEGMMPPGSFGQVVMESVECQKFLIFRRPGKLTSSD